MKNPAVIGLGFWDSVQAQEESSVSLGALLWASPWLADSRRLHQTSLLQPDSSRPSPPFLQECAERGPNFSVQALGGHFAGFSRPPRTLLLVEGTASVHTGLGVSQRWVVSLNQGLAFTWGPGASHTSAESPGRSLGAWVELRK